MKLLRLSIFLATAAWCAADAYGQLGLYGSPEPLPLQPVQASPVVARPVTAAQYAPPIYQTAGQPLPPPPGVQWQQNQPVPAPQPAPASGMSVVDQMMPMDQQNPNGPAGCGACEGAPLGDCCGEDYCGKWYGSVLTLYMTRNQPNMLYTSALDSDWAEQWGWNHFDWRVGGEIRLGRRFCCNTWSVEGAYWGLDHFYGSATPPYDAAGYDTPFQMNVPNQFTGEPDLIVDNTWDSEGNPTTPQEWFDVSPQHVIQRTNEVHNVEINLLRNRLVGDGYRPLNIDCLFGVRYFRFRDRLTFSAQHQENDWTGQPSDFAGDWIHLDDEVTNNLIGIQFGVNADYRLAQQLSVFVNPRFGLFNNRMDLDYNLYAKDASGNVLQGSSLTYLPLDYPIHASANGFSFMTQVDVGVNWQIAPRWGAMVGYRIVAVNGIGLADNQVPSYGNDTLAIARMDKNGSLILHGGFAGLTFNF